MKLKSILLALSVTAFFAVNANAVDEHHADDKAGKAAEAVPASAGAEKAETKKPMKKHNHMEEKTGMPMAEPKSHEGQTMPKNRHDHMQEKR